MLTHEDTPQGWIKALEVELTPPSLKDNTGDVDRLIKGLHRTLGEAPIHVDLAWARSLPHLLREHRYRVCVVLGEGQGAWNLLEVRKPDPGRRICGVALDLGSSTLVLRLLDVKTGETLDEATAHNPQIEAGADILSRIHYATQTRDGLERLQTLVMGRINQMIGELAERHHIADTDILGFSVAGNTTMTHFFLGLDPFWICREPYIPVVNRPDFFTAKELGLKGNPRAPVMVFPNVGSYFGGDLIAGILASGMTRQEEVSFLVDVGTNAEVVVGNQDWLMACAGAAGPALEGGVADMGMMAGPGVIDRVWIDPVTRDFDIHWIQEGQAGDRARPDKPMGICGSGLIDLAAQLFLAGMIDLRGKFVPETCKDRLLNRHGFLELVVVEERNSGSPGPLTLAQTDMDGLIRSKAAMYTILTTIAATVGIPFQEIHRFYVAGTFGSYIRPESAITIGMIPDLPLERYVSLGNTSLQGAALSLTHREARDEAFRIRDRITYLELNVNQEFMNLFSAAKFIPHTDRSLFPSVPVPTG